ncbi:MAG: GNAT family N-acetyltransferase [Pseudomonadota bacterium]
MVYHVFVETMYKLRVVTDASECQEIWRRVILQETIWDLWETRTCFHAHFQRPLCFYVVEQAGKIYGLLPLCKIEENNSLAYFPGETWQEKTWLEQNRIFARDANMLAALLEQCPLPYHIRYLLPLDFVPEDRRVVDEKGFLFLPPRYDYNVENFFQEFSRRSLTRLKNDLAAFESLGVRYRYNDLADFDQIIQLNLDRFGESSFFDDTRFCEGFRSLLHFLHNKSWLRLTAVLINDELVAVDMGCIYRGTYTLFAGGTNASYPGVAKLINTHHMQYACREKLQAMDFLCGGSSWKNIFHLSPRPLYLLSNANKKP